MVENVPAFFEDLPARLSPDAMMGMNATYQFVITEEGGGEWYIVFKEGRGEIVQGRKKDADVTITASASNWLDLINGGTSGQMSLVTGRVRLEGDVTLAVKLHSLLQVR